MLFFFIPRVTIALITSSRASFEVVAGGHVGNKSNNNRNERRKVLKNIIWGEGEGTGRGHVGGLAKLLTFLPNCDTKLVTIPKKVFWVAVFYLPLLQTATQNC